MESAHYELAKGTAQENFAYCTKEESRVAGTEPFHYGQFHEPDQGKRNDLITLRDGIKAGRTFTDLADDPITLSVLARHMPFYKAAKTEYQRATPRNDIHVTFCYGPAGTGKSTCAGLFDESDTTFVYDGGFWEGYSGQPKVILDEFGGHTMQPLVFNRVCDRGPYTVNIKGSSAPLRATDIRITSNYLPERWWGDNTRFNYEAVERRIHEAHYHPDIDVVVRFESDEATSALFKLKEHISRYNFVRRD